MSAEPMRVAKTEAWAEWENKVVNRVFPLRRFLGGSNHSAVFLTEYKAENLPDAAIKLVPADMLQTEAQLVQWGTAATLTHPHLVRVFDVGRCQLGGRAFLFLVMEYAEQTLAQILPQRALSPDEVREMLLPTLDALAFLHRNQLVHGQLKPSNFLVVNDQLKLASDTLRPTGSTTGGIVGTTVYDPPELRDGVISTAGDIWGLGMTLVEALTQRTPAWPDETVSLPTGFPAPFVDTVRQCLNRTPTNRPTVAELEAQCRPAPPAPVASVPQKPVRAAPREATSPQNSPKRPLWVPAISAALVISLAVWVGLRLFQTQPNSGPSTPSMPQEYEQPADATAVASTEVASTEAAPTKVAPPAAAAPAAAVAEPHAAARPAVADPTVTQPTAADPTVAQQPTAALAASSPASYTEPAAAAPHAATPHAAAPGATAPAASAPPVPAAAVPGAAAFGTAAPEATSPSVLHKVMPDVSRVIQNRIRGHIHVTVRVLVDPAGNVVGQLLENPGPSRYFARLAGNAAGDWKFAPEDTHDRRVWKLQFEFTRSSATVQATAAQ
jgi:serine/threonine protein kinase